MEQLTFWSEDSPVSRSALQEGAEDLTTREGNWRSPLSDWLIKQMHGGLSEKMCQPYCQVGKERILQQSSPLYVGGKSQCPQGVGRNPACAQTPQDTTEWRGECWTQNLSEFPDSRGLSLNGVDDCSLSDTVASWEEILETGSIPRRYYLTVKAAKGILRRAKVYGNRLPPPLPEVLKSLVSNEL